MLKVAMVTPGYLPVPAVNGGAVEVLIEDLLQGNEKDKKCKIDCYTVPNDKLKEYKFENTSIIQLNIKKTTQIINKVVNILYKMFKVKKWRTSFSRELIKEMKGKKYDYVVVHNNLMAYRDIYEKTENKDNLVYVLHNNINEDDINHVLIAKLIGKTAKKVLAVSDYTGNDFKRISGATDVQVLYNCIDFHRYFKEIPDEEKNVARKKYNIYKNDFVFMYSGRIDIYKGVLELVEAFKKIDNPNTKLMIVGKSWFDESDCIDEYTEKIKIVAEEIKDRIIFTGFIDSEHMPLMYQISDCLVVPSIWEEPFGVVALEGMASGLPLIVTNSGGLMEIVDNSCAFVVNKEENLVDNLSDKMKEIIINLSKAKLMGDHSKQLVKENSEYDSRNYFSNFMKKIGAYHSEEKNSILY